MQNSKLKAILLQILTAMMQFEAKAWPAILIFKDLEFQEEVKGGGEVEATKNLDLLFGGVALLDEKTVETLQIQENRSLKEEEIVQESETHEGISEAELPIKIKTQLEKGRIRIAYIMSKILIFNFQNQSARNLIQHAKIQIKLNMEDSALLVMKKANKRYPGHSEITRLLGLLLLYSARKSEDYKECFSLLLKSTALLNNNNNNEFYHVLNFEKLICSLLIKDPKNIEKYVRRCKFTLNSRLEDFLYIYCVRLSENQFVSHSLRVLQALLKTYPEARCCEQNIFALCWLLYQTKQWSKCLNIFKTYQFRNSEMAEYGEKIKDLARNFYNEELKTPFLPQAPSHIESFSSELESKYGCSNEVEIKISQ